MRFSDFLGEEWRPALGCTEPACIAYAASVAAARVGGGVSRLRLCCDPRMYKNCYAVGIPGSGGRSGIVWAAALGAMVDDPEAMLEVFSRTTEVSIARAASVIEAGAVEVTVDQARTGLWVDCEVEGRGGTARAVISGDHTNLVRLETNGRVELDRAPDASPRGGDVRTVLAGMSFTELLVVAEALTMEDRCLLARGIKLNTAIAEHGVGLFPATFMQPDADVQTRVSHHVCGGVHARMSGEDFTVMTLAGSGNKGIVVAVPMAMWAEHLGLGDEARDRALAVACLVTSAATHHLGTLSAMCGSANAAGIGLAAGRVVLEGGGPEHISMAVTNMVGNLTGMICDGAKIGCGLKVMTGVDAAHRAASLALAGVGIPVTDGIVGDDGLSSLANLGRVATRGMLSTDVEILGIMGEKLDRTRS